MKLTRIASVSMVVVALFTAGCNSFKISENSSQLVDIQKRAILVGGAETTVATVAGTHTKTVTNFKVCAEPSPDAMSAMAMDAAAKGGVPGKVSVELSAALQQSAAFVGLRTTSIQLLRDFGYRLCEAYLSGAIEPGQYDLLMRRFQKNVVALLAIEQLTGAVKAPPIVLTAQGRAETAQSLSDQRDIREKVSKKIDDLEKEKKTKETEKADLLKANASADTKDLDSLITAKDAEIKRQQKDLETIDKSIATARGTLVEGQTTATIHSENSPTTRSDEAMKKVAEVVENISMAIVQSDDVTQLCILTLGSITDTQNSVRVKFADWCQKELDLNQKERDIYLTSLANQIAAKEKILADSNSTPAQKLKADEDLTTLRKKAEKEKKGIGIYNFE